MKLVKTLRNGYEESIPFWFMRQAGRYLPEYNRSKGHKSFIETILDVDLATTISLQPYIRYRTDGIIVFADILTPYLAIDIPLSFKESGPKLEFDIFSRQDIKKLYNFEPNLQLEYLRKIIQNLREFIQKENSESSLIGFAGAPFTMLSYLIEKGNSRKLDNTKEFLFNFEAQALEILEILTNLTVEYLKFQIHSGVELVQLFDSWGGILSSKHYREFCFPFLKQIIDAIKPLVPIIIFVGNNTHLIDQLVELEPDAISLDWRVNDISKIPSKIGIQGNLDPAILLGSTERVQREVWELLNTFSVRKNFIFNLGHGILPSTPIHNVNKMVDTIKRFKRKTQ
ncbi:MAG: uroporphyrinogen decarboxylase [Leptonema sp. (in: bacteria)]